MSRIRSIKPEFFTDEHVADLPALDRLVFIGLWTIADKAGRLEDRPKRIKALLLPYENADIVKILDRLTDAKFLIRYRDGDRALIQIRTWTKHQRVHHTEAESELPPPNGDVPVIEPVPNGELTDGREGVGKGKEGEGDAVALFVESWNRETAKPIGRCEEVTKTRRAQIRARLKDRPLEDWRGIFQRVQASDFCRGLNDRGWHATIDWILRPDTAAKVIEGAYDNRKATVVQHGPPVTLSALTWAEQRELQLAELRAEEASRKAAS